MIDALMYFDISLDSLTVNIPVILSSFLLKYRVMYFYLNLISVQIQENENRVFLVTEEALKSVKLRQRQKTVDSEVGFSVTVLDCQCYDIKSLCSFQLFIPHIK